MTTGLTIHYTGVNGDSAELSRAVCLKMSGFWSEPAEYQTSHRRRRGALLLLRAGRNDRALPCIECDNFVIPGITSSCSMSPIIAGSPSGSYLNGISYLGRGWSSDPETVMTQQWGLPVHYFCGFHTTPYGFHRRRMWISPAPRPRTCITPSAAGSRTCRRGDLMIDNFGGRASMYVNYRSDLWKQMRGPGRSATWAPASTGPSAELL